VRVNARSLLYAPRTIFAYRGAAIAEIRGGARRRVTESKTPADDAGEYCCPACRGPVRAGEDSYGCPSCARTFPVLCGIPDFRLNPDPYLSLADERAKAQYLHDYGCNRSLRDMLAEYYRITDDVPQDMAEKFTSYVLEGEARAGEVFSALPAPYGRMLDAGCASAGAVTAARRRGADIVGMDIALRWLVIGAKRLSEAGIEARLVCADIMAPPFRDGRFDTVIAADLLEHVAEPRAAVAAISALLKPGGGAYISAANRFTLGPYPLAGLWGVGYLPRGLRRRYVAARRGIDTLRHATLLSPASLARLVEEEGFSILSLGALRIAPAATGPALRRGAIAAYRKMRLTPGVSTLLLHAGPAFEIVARRTSHSPNDGKDL
jgi:2-polyprenyl-3-methyl-5-hydroxy-6-metoxy-1,4-benzoquinol methylase